MLNALLSREALPRDRTCLRCAAGRTARWRCKDCTAPTLLCRGCLRQTHMDNPLHRVEKWTDRFFRPAELWEVGVYFLIPHHWGESICGNLKWQIERLERFQKLNDEQEELGCRELSDRA